MAITTVFNGASISVIDYRCEAKPGDEPFVEWHDAFTVSYVRKGSFGYRFRGQSYELVAGSFLVGHPGDEYMCTHDHSGGDECLSFYFNPSLVDAIGGPADAWQAGCLPPLADMMVFGELGQAAASGRSAIGVDEVGLILAGRFVDAVSGRTRRPESLPATRPPACGRNGPLDRRTFARANRPRRGGTPGRPQSIPFPSALFGGARRHATSVPGAVEAAPRRAPAGRRRAWRHRDRLRRRVRRLVELRSDLPPCRRCVTPGLPKRRERRPQDLPRSADDVLATMTSRQA